MFDEKILKRDDRRVQSERVEFALTNNSKSKDDKNEEANNGDASATSTSGRVSRIAPLASSFECVTRLAAAYLGTYLPTYSV
jgi:hypothetical protein